MKKIVTELKIKVLFYDLDPMNIVWHGNYVKYLEQARCDFFAKLGYDYMQMYADGVMYPIAKMDFKFIKSAKFEDNLIVRCTLKELEPAIIIKYDIVSEDGEKILSAHTMQMAVATKTGETLFEAPERLKKAIEDFEEKEYE